MFILDMHGFACAGARASWWLRLQLETVSTLACDNCTMAETDFVKRELAKDVYMYTKRTDVDKEVPGYVGVKQTSIEYAVECSAFRELQFTLKWGDGTQNLAWPEDLEATSVTVKCLPYERKPLVTLVQQGTCRAPTLAAAGVTRELSPTNSTHQAGPVLSVQTFFKAGD